MGRAGRAGRAGRTDLRGAPKTVSPEEESPPEGIEMTHPPAPPAPKSHEHLRHVTMADSIPVKPIPLPGPYATPDTTRQERAKRNSRTGFGGIKPGERNLTLGRAASKGTHAPRSPKDLAEEDKHRLALAEHPQAQYVVRYLEPPKIHPQKQWGAAAGAGEGSTAQLTPVTLPSEERKIKTAYPIDWAETTTAPKQTLLLMQGKWPQNPKELSSSVKSHYILAIPSADILPPIQRVHRATLSPPSPSVLGLPPFRPRHPGDTEGATPSWASVRAGDAGAGSAANTLERLAIDLEAQGKEAGEFSIPQVSMDTDGISFEAVQTPDQAAEERVKNRKACVLLYAACCGTPQKKISSLALFLILLAGLGTAAFYIYKKLHPDCQNDLSLQTYPLPPSSQAYAPLFNLIKFVFESSSSALANQTNTTAISVAASCGAALSAKAFLENRGTTSVTIPGVGGYPSIQQIFEANQASVTQNGKLVEFNFTEAENITCGISREGQIRVEYLDPKTDRQLHATLPARFNGYARPYTFSLPEIKLLTPGASSETFRPFEDLEISALHPEYTTRPTLVLPTQQPHVFFNNLPEMRALLEQNGRDGRIDFNPRGDNWVVSGSPEDLKDIFSQFEANMLGDTAVPGTSTQDFISLGIIDPCLESLDLTSPDQIHTQKLSVLYTAYETPLTLTYPSASSPLNTTAGVKYPLFENWLNFSSGSVYGNYQVVISPIISGTGLPYLNAITPFNIQSSIFGDWVVQGNISTISDAIRRYEESIRPNFVPSGFTSLYRTGANITDLHTGIWQLTPPRQIFVTNPAQAYSHAGPHSLSLIPGQATQAFINQTLDGNLWDLMQMQVTANAPGLQFPPDTNIIPIGSNGFICIQRMPYCDSYFRQATQYTLPVGPSGTTSYSHITTEEKGLISGLVSSNSLDLSGCNPVVLASLDFTRTPGVLSKDQFYPFQELGFNSSTDPKDALRTDFTGSAKIFDLSRNSSWSEKHFIGTFSGLSHFFEGIEILIPSLWPAGETTAFNITAWTGFNALECEGSPIISHSESRVISHKVTDFPAEVDTPFGTTFSRTPGTSLIFGDAFLFKDQNLGQENNGSVNCAVTQSPAGVGEFAFTFQNISFRGNQSSARQQLALAAVFLPDYGPDNNPGFLPSTLECTGTYGESNASISIERVD